ncbi:MAG: MucB/RseB C-terminal domain-containing protein [Azoarcus sp.]|jgi:sigma-E factor negative regulatory protein RseB|nr:MucB/RseB C-terminal domain-containing protein [Azoarcus sp.]
MKPVTAMRLWLVLGLCALYSQTFANPANPADEAPMPVSVPSSTGDPAALIDSVPAAGAVKAPENWLERIAMASQQLNYIGTFSYQTGRRFETSRIAHRYSDGEENERMEVLDGSPREVVRRGDEVRCVLPAQRTVIISRVVSRIGFPSRLSQHHAEVADNYLIREEELGRIAGREARKLVLEPRDGLRFGHVLWADVRTGLLLKSQVLNARGEVVEQFTFSDVRIGADVDEASLAAQLVTQVQPEPDWRTINVGSDDAKPDEERWRLREPLPGFALTSKVQHRNGGALQMVFSDGLAAISVFIEPAQAGVEARGSFPAGGAVNAFERIVGGHRITVLGEVPAEAAQRVAETIEVIGQ